MQRLKDAGLVLLMILGALLLVAGFTFPETYGHYGKCQRQQQILKEHGIDVTVHELFWHQCPGEYWRVQDKRLPPEESK